VEQFEAESAKIIFRSCTGGFNYIV